MRLGPRAALPLRPVLAALTVALAAVAVVAGPASASGRHHDQRLVVRGDSTAVDGPCDAAGICPVDLTGGHFRGAPVGTGDYTASFELVRGSGRSAGATGAGVATFSEDAAKHHRMTLVGRIEG